MERIELISPGADVIDCSCSRIPGIVNHKSFAEPAAKSMCDIRLYLFQNSARYSYTRARRQYRTMVMQHFI